MEKLVRKIILYVAIRLDGYIVRGDVALHGQGVNSENQNSNQQFLHIQIQKLWAGILNIFIHLKY